MLVWYMFMCVCLNVCLHACSEPRAAFASSSVTLWLIPLEARALLNLKFVFCPSAGSQQVPAILPAPLSSGLACRHAWDAGSELWSWGLSSKPSLSLAPLQSVLIELCYWLFSLAGVDWWGGGSASNQTQGLVREANVSRLNDLLSSTLPSWPGELINRAIYHFTY